MAMRVFSRSALRLPRCVSGPAVALVLAAAAMPAAAQGINNYAAQTEVRISELESRIRTLTGQIEQLQHRNAELADRLDRALADLEFRVEELESGAAGDPAAVGAAPARQEPQEQEPQEWSSPGSLGTLSTIEPPPDQPLAGLPLPGLPPQNVPAAPAPGGLPQGDPTAQYDAAYGLLERSDFAGAEMAFRRFLEAYPTHPLASNARYWLGETYYVRGRFDDAAVAFAENYQAAPTGAKAVDSLLKLGMSLGALGRQSDACLTFQQLQVEFPAAPSPILRRAEQERSRLQCS